MNDNSIYTMDFKSYCQLADTVLSREILEYEYKTDKSMDAPVSGSVSISVLYYHSPGGVEVCG